MNTIRLFEVRANGEVLHLAGVEQITELLSLLAQSLHDTHDVDGREPKKSWSIRNEGAMECRHMLVSRRPKRVRTTRAVQSDLTEFKSLGKPLRIARGVEVEVLVGGAGAVAAKLPGGRLLGLKPDEFKVIEWEQEVVG